MPRLADAVAEGAFGFPSFLDAVEDRPVVAALRQHLTLGVRDAPVIVADNVAQAMLDMALAGREDDFDYQRELPCLAAPFGQFWVECRAPAGAGMSGYRGWGALITARDFDAAGPEVRGQLADVFGGQQRWLLQASMVYDRGPLGVVAGWCDWTMGLDDLGRPLGGPTWMLTRSEGPSRARLDAASQQTLTDVAALLSWPLLQAICFLHCTNVELVEHRPPRRPPVRRGGRTVSRPLLRYHTLNVMPGTTTRSATTPGKDGIEQGVALHLMRGHFKDYRGGGGLFGRHHGLYWWGPALRGSGLRGVVDKTYAVSAAEDAPAPRTTR